jgi:hypothetical protein
MDDLFDQVHALLNGVPNGRGFLNADCPYCGKEAKAGHNHFGYNAHSYKCFVCGSTGNLKMLADHLSLDTAHYTQPVCASEPKPKPIAAWRKHPDKLLAKYQTHPHGFAAWQRYKALRPATIDRFGFGLGRLPFQRKDGAWYLSKREWLIVPLYEDGQLVGLRGRNRSAHGPKWISATGSQYALWGVDTVQPGRIVWLCENYVDAAWLMQAYPEWSAVAIGGATTWKAAWADRLAAQQPDTVIVALDNDLAGAARGATLRRLQAEWVRDRGTQPPQSNGPRIANSLRRAGVHAVLFEWPDDAPVKAGIDWILEQRDRVAT